MTKAGGECEGTLPSSAPSFAGMVGKAGRERAPATTLPRSCAIYRLIKPFCSLPLKDLPFIPFS